MTLDTPGGLRTLKDHAATDRRRCDSVPGAIIVTTRHTLTTSAFTLSDDLLQAIAEDPRPATTIVIDGVGTTHCAVVAYPREFRLLRQAATRVGIDTALSIPRQPEPDATPMPSAR